MINFKVLGIVSAFVFASVLCSLAYKKSQIIRVESLDKITIEIAIEKLQGKTFETKDGKSLIKFTTFEKIRL